MQEAVVLGRSKRQQLSFYQGWGQIDYLDENKKAPAKALLSKQAHTWDGRIFITDASGKHWLDNAAGAEVGNV
eukprot:4746939-Prorocentrum_lima.AAC.1